MYILLCIHNRSSEVSGGTTLFDWDEHNTDHIADHGLDPDEVEEAFHDPRRIARSTYNTVSERRSAIVGATAAGRLLFVVFTSRHGLIRVVTARDATTMERRRYRTRGK